MTDRERELFRDNSLSDGARLIGLLLFSIGAAEEWVEVSHQALSRLLHGYPSSETIRRCVRQLEMAGYAETRSGGRAHGQAYRIKAHNGEGLNDKAHNGEGLNDKAHNGEGLNDKAHNGEGLNDKAHNGEGLNGPSREATRTDAVLLSLTDNSDGEDGGEQNARARPIAPDAERALAGYGDLFHGTRGSLRDYLARRVDPGRHYGWIQTLAMWLNDLRPVFRYPDGSKVPITERPMKLAAALNDLAASDEKLGNSRPVGDPANLQRKLSVMLRDDFNARDDNGTSGNRRGPAGKTEGGARSPGAAGDGEFDHVR